MGFRLFFKFFVIVCVVSNAAYAGDECSRELSRLDKIAEFIATQSNAVKTKAGNFEGMKVVYDAFLDTIRYESVNGRVPVGSRVIVPFHHGGGTFKSHSEAMVQVMHIFTSSAARKSELVKKLAALESRIPIAGEIIDAPGHRFGPDAEKFPKIENLVEWLAEQIRSLKAYGLPIVPFCRSASTGYFLELHRRYPDLLDGLVLMSPVDPFISMIEGRKALELQAAEGRLVINEVGLRFVEEMYKQMDWSDLKGSLKNLPVLVMIGGKDIETPKETREYFQNLLADTHPLSRVHIEAEAGHEVLSVYDKVLGARTFGITQDFIFQVVKEFEAKKNP